MMVDGGLNSAAAGLFDESLRPNIHTFSIFAGTVRDGFTLRRLPLAPCAEGSLERNLPPPYLDHQSFI